MQTQHIQVELDIDTGSATQNAGIEQLLPPALVDSIAARTLQLAGITRSLTLSLLITSDEVIRVMNREYRQQDNATDVLSFPLLDTPLVDAPAAQLWQPLSPQTGADQQHANHDNHLAKPSSPTFILPPGLPTNLGDIVISWPTVQQQAQSADHSPLYELLYLFSHGILHLIGYDDHNEAGYLAMVHTQETALQSILPAAEAHKQ